MLEAIDTAGGSQALAEHGNIAIRGDGREDRLPGPVLRTRRKSKQGFSVSQGNGITTVMEPEDAHLPVRLGDDGDLEDVDGALIDYDYSAVLFAEVE
jgi:hypothetical protein